MRCPKCNSERVTEKKTWRKTGAGVGPRLQQLPLLPALSWLVLQKEQPLVRRWERVWGRLSRPWRVQLLGAPQGAFWEGLLVDYWPPLPSRALWGRAPARWLGSPSAPASTVSTATVANSPGDSGAG